MLCRRNRPVFWNSIRKVKTCANASKIAKHARSFDHRVDFDNSSVIDKGSFPIRKTLEAWHTTEHADNNLSRFQTSIVFFLNNSHPIYTFLLCFCSSYCFYLAFSCIYFIILHSSFYPSKAVDRQPKAHVLFWIFLPANVFIVILIKSRKVGEFV